jgi:tetratricopeptide (TPR) repeat protein
MARAAVKAKQQQAKAQTQPAKPRRGRRRHSGGGNPNQDLFFVKLRRGQRWLYGLLAVVFALTFVGVGIGSGSGGLSQLWTGIFGGSGAGSISKAQSEIKTNPAKGYRDLATAYESKGQTADAISALQSYVVVRKKDANAWAELGGLQETQAQKYTSEYTTAQQSSQLADPSSAFLPGGALATAVGSNSAYQTAAQQASTRLQNLYQQALSALGSAVSNYRQVTKIQPKNATAWSELATAAHNAGEGTVELHALHRYLAAYPNSPLRKQIEAQIKQVKNSLAQTGSSTPKK